MRTLRKFLAALIGFPLLALGIILIPIPGPGLLVCLGALFVLSFGFDWARTYLDKCKLLLGKIYTTAKQRADKIEHRDDS